jgi:hypothetical protein
MFALFWLTIGFLLFGHGLLMEIKGQEHEGLDLCVGVGMLLGFAVAKATGIL